MSRAAAWLTRAVTLAALVGLGMLLRSIAPPLHGGALAAMLLGFTLLTAYVAGDLAAGLRLPRITGYVLSGVLVGPYALGVLTPGAVESLRTIDRLALALIALTAGGELRLQRLRGQLRSLLALSFAVVVVVGVGIFVLGVAARPLVPFLRAGPPGLAVAAAALLGVWCANSAPDATIAVINETHAEGRYTETIIGVTILKDVIVIISFAAVLALVRPLAEPGRAFDPTILRQIGWEVGGALVLGALAGLAFAFYLERIGARSVLSTLVFAFLLSLLADAVHVELLLAAVGAGFAIENLSAAGDAFIDAVERNAVVVFALFFALAGAVLNLPALATYWPLALGIVLVRAALTWAGVRVGARLGGSGVVVARSGWMGLISQAGVTLGLSLLVAREFPDWGGEFVAITGAVIIFHLLFGPVLLKVGLTRAGETGAQRGAEAGTAPPGAAPAALGTSPAAS